MDSETTAGRVLTNEIPSEATPQQRQILNTLLEMKIDFRVMSCNAAITIEECEPVGQALEANLVKTLFVANRQLTRFHLVSMPGHKPFVTRQFTHGRGVSRVSFVSAESLDEMLETPVGGAGPFSIIADKGNKVEMVMDTELEDMEWVALPVLSPNMYAAVRISDIRDRFLPALNHNPVIITMKETL